MNLKLSCADSAFPKLSHEGSLAVISDLGFRAVDVCSFTGYRHTPPEDVLADPARAAAVVTERLQLFGLAVSDVFVILGESFAAESINHPDAAVRKRSLADFTSFVELARLIGSPGITVLPGVEFEGVPVEQSMALAAEGLNARAELAGEAGLHLAFEPHYGSIAATPATALDLIGRAPDVGFALDYSHFVYQDIAESEIDELLPRTTHFHVRATAPGVIQARTSESTVDFRRVRDALLGLGYDGYFAIEYQWEDGWLDFSHVDCIAETAETRDLLLTEGGS